MRKSMFFGVFLLGVLAAPVFAQSQSENYVGADICTACHKEQHDKYAKTKHLDLIRPARSNQKVVVGCETCHGPGKAHADGEVAANNEKEQNEAKKLIFSFTKDPKKSAERCLTCHQSGLNQKDFDHSPHAKLGVACSTCHTMHDTVEANIKLVSFGNSSSARVNALTSSAVPEERRWLNNKLLKKSQPDLCFTCHADIQAKFSLPNHHRVPEGLLKCTDCHNPHGTSNRATLRLTGWETCVSCHSEKRGPFAFEHSSVKVEGCIACHEPHGSVNKKLLKRTETRFLCLSCHVQPQAANVPHGRLGFQTRGDCTRCHVAIHGSNLSEFFLH